MDKSQLKINNYFLISPVKKLKWSKLLTYNKGHYPRYASATSHYHFSSPHEKVLSTTA